MKTLAIGLMSGTSLDGLDICLAEFEKKDKWHFQILKAETLPYSTDWENKLRNSIHFSVTDLLELHSDYGFYLGKKLKNL
jgi:anhydro-N-acetylmuramic acid kinase